MRWTPASELTSGRLLTAMRYSALGSGKRLRALLAYASAETIGASAELAEDDDNQVSEAAIWSLGQVGGDVARQALAQLLERAEDEEMRDFIDEAMENLVFTNEVAEFSLLEFGPDDDDPLDLDDALSDGGDEDEPA